MSDDAELIARCRKRVYDLGFELHKLRGNLDAIGFNPFVITTAAGPGTHVAGPLGWAELEAWIEGAEAARRIPLAEAEDAQARCAGMMVVLADLNRRRKGIP